MNERDTLKIVGNDLVIGEISANDLVKQYGTPLYVLDEQYIRAVAKAYKNGILEGYEGGKSAVAFASKSLSNVCVIKITCSEGLMSDVVSGGEIFVAMNAGVKPENMIFHGNNKTESELNFALNVGVGFFVVDNFDEIERLQRLAKEQNKVANCILRVNPLVSAHTFSAVQTAKADSKFGVVIGEESKKAIKNIIGQENLHFAGLHSHIGSQIFDYNAFEQAIEVMTNFAKELFDEGIEIEVLNIGGGLGIYYTDEDPKFTPKRYQHSAKNLAMLVKNSFVKFGMKLPMLVVEPGRSIVGEAGVTLYTVGTIKDLGVRKYVGVDGGMFENPRYALYESKYSACVANKAGMPQNEIVTICGKCCESGDMIAVDTKLQNAQVGDIVAVFSTGAYNYSMASNYNMNPIPPMVLVNGKKSDYIVKPQTYEDLIRLNNIANWLK